MSVLLRLIVVALLWISATGAQAATVDDARNKGLAWLYSHQSGDGSWKSAANLQVQPTAAAVEAMLNAGINRGYAYSQAQAWLGNAETTSTDGLSRQIIALWRSGANVTSRLDQLLGMKSRSDRAIWGAYSMFDMSFPDSPLALSAIRTAQYSYTNQTNDLGNAVYCEILPSQRSDGGWSYIKPPSTTPTLVSASAILPTAYTIIELHAIKTAKGWDGNTCGTTYYLSTAINNGVAWLLTKRNGDGGFGDNGQSSLLETALVYLVLNAVNSTDPAKDAALNYLLTQQDTAGSWQSDSFQTALVLSMLPTATLTDTDKDGIPDAVEAILGSNPLVADSRSLVSGNGQSVSGVTASVLVGSTGINQSFTKTLTASGGTAPYSWSIVSGSLPDGLSFNGTTGVISGTPTTAGTFNFIYKVTDSINSSTTTAGQIVVQADTTAPTGTVTINSGAASTNSTSAPLTLTCSDGGSGCSQMQFSNDNASWSTAEAYATSKAWTLTAGDGIKTVYVKFKDTAGNWSSTYNDTIVLDATVPSSSASPVGGTYSSSQSVTLSCSDGTGSGCDKIYYTTDGSTPTTASTVYTTPLSISTTTSLKYFAKDLAGNSESVKSQMYTMDATAPTTSASPVGGTYSSPQSVTLTCSDGTGSGCDKIYYTTDGSTPTTASTVYSATIIINASTTLKYFAKDLAGNSETVKSQTYTIDTTAPITTASPVGGTYSSTQNVTLTCSDGSGSGCNKIYYTTDGTNPTTASIVYTASISISTTTTLKYFAKDLAGNSETVKSQAYNIDTTAPLTTATPVGGTYGSSQNVTLACSDGAGSGCDKIYYTIDGTTPTTASTVYTAAINISSTATLKYFAKDLAGNSEVVKSQAYTIDTTAPTTTASPVGGTYNSTQSVTLICSDGTGYGCDKIYYTTDGTNPTTASTVYTATISISTTTTLKYFTKDLAGNSETVKTQMYTIDTTAPVTSVSPVGGMYNSPQGVTLTCSDGTGSGCDKIYYTTDGSTPTTSSTVYTSAISINTTTTLKYFAKDLAGNSETVKSQTYTIDTTAPTGTVTINNGAVSTNSTSATLSLTCTDTNGCSQMQFSNDNTNWSTAETYVTGKAWTLVSGDGIKTVYAKFKDTAGNWSIAYNDTIVLDATAPSAPMISVPASGTVQNTANVALSGTAEASSTVKIYDGAALLGNITANGAGVWSYTTATLADGSHNFTATATDAAGNASSASVTVTVNIDTTAPIAPIITTPASGTIQNTSSVTLTGTAETSSTVKVYDGAVLLGSVTATAGSWTYTASSLASGSHSFTVTATDTAGNISVTSTAVAVTIDTTAPVTTASPVGGTYSSSQSVTLTCSDGAGSGCDKIYYTVDGTTPTTASTVYTAAISVSTTITLKYFAKDLAGNNEIVKSQTYNIDTTAPTTAASPVGGTYGSTQAVTLTCSDGTGSGCDKIYYTTDGTTPTTASTVYTTPLNISTTTTLKYFATDLAGNSEVVKSQAYTIDTTAPVTTASPVGGTYSSTQSVTLSCSDGAGSGCDKIYYTVDGTTPTMTSPVYSAAISISTTTTLKYFAKDLAGNSEAVKSQAFVLDATAPVTTSIPVGGTYNSSQNVMLSCSDGAGSGCDKIFYTVDGTTPTTASPVYSAAISISTTTSLKYFAKDLAGNSEAVKSQIYTIDTTAPVTSVSPVGGMYSSTQSVTLTCADGAGSGCDKIYYTTDGSMPTTASPVYTSEISISTTTTLKYFAKDLAGNSEAVKSQTYTIDTTAPTTSASPVGGTYSSLQSVTLACSDGTGSGCDKVYYTTDGTTPTAASTAYTAPISIGTTTTLKYFAKDLAGNSEAVKSQTYTIDTTAPVTTATPVGGTFNSSQSVTLTCSDGAGSGCDKIYYTVDGTTPTTASPVYTTPLNISTTTTLKHFATDLAGNSEVVKSQTYTIDTTAPVTTASPVGGTYSSTQSVTLSCSDGAGSGCDKIYYTVDGTTPTMASPVYSAAINISSTTALRYFAKDLAGNNESVKSQAYNIDTTAPTTAASPVGGTYGAPQSITLTCSDGTGSGCDKIYYTTDGSTPTTASPVYATPISISTTTSLKYFAKDLAGNGEAVKSQAYAIDATAPTGSITINSGAASTNSAGVTLSLTCNDAGGCSEMQFSNDNANWSASEAYAMSKGWTLAAGDGTKTVYAKFKDMAGNWSSAYSDAIVLDAAVPTTTVSPVGGTYSSSQSVTLTCNDGAGSGCDKIYYTTDGANPTTASTVYTAPLSISTTTTLKYFAKDLAGNSEGVKSEVYTISTDSTAPVTTASPAGGAYNSGQSITLTCADGAGSGCDKIYYTTDGTTPTTASTVYTSPISISTTTTLKYFAKDIAGNSEAAQSQMYTIDTTAPTGTVTINGGAASTNSTTVTLSLTCTDAGGCGQMQFSNDNVSWSAAEGLAASRNWTLSVGDGTKIVYVKFKDAAGNWSATYSDTITLNTYDLTITSVSGYAGYETVNITMPIDITYTIKNKGSSNVAEVKVGVYLSTDATITADDTFLWADTVSSLGAGVEIKRNIWSRAPANMAAGTYYIGVIADYSGSIVELDETNNALAGTQITITTASPDLTVTTVATSTSGNKTEPISVAYTIKNQGGATGCFYVYFYLSTDSTITTSDTYVGYAWYGYSIDPGAQVTMNALVRVPAVMAAGTYYIGALVDPPVTGYPSGYVTENNEANNTLAGNTISVTAVSPELTITSVSGPASANPSEVVTVSTTIKNQGGNTGGFYVYLYLSADATITTSDTYMGYGPSSNTYLGYAYVSSIPSGSQTTLNISGKIPKNMAAGTYYIGAYIDPPFSGYPSGYVAESNETNNALAGNTMTVTTTAPDLTITTVSGPTSANITEVMTVQALIKNQGGSAGGFYVSAYLSTDSTINYSDTLLGYVWYPYNLVPGAQTTVDIPVRIPMSMPAGSYFIGAMVDDGNNVSESNETNNFLAGNSLSVSATLPDLSVTTVSGPATGVKGQPITVSITTSNNVGATANFYTGIYLSTDATITTRDTLVGYIYYGSFAGGTSQAMNWSLTIPTNLASGTYYIGAVADFTSAVIESNETNNALTGNQISITP